MDIRSQEPFWIIKNELRFSYPSLKKDASSQILIIGAGITGALMAHYLVENGYEVMVVDRRDVATGSTAASTAMLQYEIDVPLSELIEQRGLQVALASYKACEESIYELEKLVKAVNSKCGFMKKESVYLASRRKDLDFLQKEYETRKEYGFDVRWCSEKALSRMGVNAPGAIVSKSGAVMDAHTLAQDLLRKVYKKGGAIYDRTEIDRIDDKEGYLLCKTKGGPVIKAEHVVHCTGFESTETLNENVVNLLSTFAIASEKQSRLQKVFKDYILWNTSDPYLYFRSTSEGRIIMGGADHPFKNAMKRDALLPKKEKSLLKDFSKVFPNTEFTPDYSWAGTFGETKDGLPYMGRPQPDRNEYYALGFGGNGITFSVMAREAILADIQKEPHPYLEYYKFGR